MRSGSNSHLSRDGSPSGSRHPHYQQSASAPLNSTPGGGSMTTAHTPVSHGHYAHSTSTPLPGHGATALEYNTNSPLLITAHHNNNMHPGVEAMPSTTTSNNQRMEVMVDRHDNKNGPGIIITSTTPGGGSSLTVPRSRSQHEGIHRRASLPVSYLSSPAKLDFRKKGLSDQKSSKKSGHRSPLLQKRITPDLAALVNSSGGRHRSSSNPDNDGLLSSPAMSINTNDSHLGDDPDSFAEGFHGNLTIGSAGPIGTDVSIDDVDGSGGTIIDPQRTKAIKTSLQTKIQRTMELIKDEQNQKEDNVNEYLRLADNAEKHQQQQRIKTLFEKRNQKSTQKISELQRKLETYKNRLHDIEVYGVTQHRPPKEMLRDMGQGLKDVGSNIRDGFSGLSGGVVDNIRGAKDSIVSKPKEFAHLIKNKFGSADNINNIKQMEENQENPEEVERQPSTLPTNFKYSDEDGSSATSESNPSASGTQSSPRPLTQMANTNQSYVLSSHTPVASLPPGSAIIESGSNRAPGSRPPGSRAGSHVGSHVGSGGHESEVISGSTLEYILRVIDDKFSKCEHLQMAYDKLKTQVEEESSFYKQSFEDERFRNERLEEQINDFTELHQHEVTNIKQELQSMEEKMEYQLEERTRDMQELLETCQTRITKMELQQQQQQLISMEGFENSPLRGVVTKLINVFLAILAVILVVVSTVPNLLGPFLTTRVRILFTLFFAACAISAYQNWDLLCSTTSQLTDYITHTILSRT